MGPSSVPSQEEGWGEGWPLRPHVAVGWPGTQGPAGRTCLTNCGGAQTHCLVWNWRGTASQTLGRWRSAPTIVMMEEDHTVGGQGCAGPGLLSLGP